MRERNCKNKRKELWENPGVVALEESSVIPIQWELGNVNCATNTVPPGDQGAGICTAIQSIIGRWQGSNGIETASVTRGDSPIENVRRDASGKTKCF